jgi:6-pyruvoyltetrahydropterin/6-carboxytetrahydropterin synthase
MSRTTLHLSKQNFKFSAAHFLIFDAQRAERLHGHNYQVRVDIEFSKELSSVEHGYFVDFNIFKSHILQSLQAWDEMVLMPKLHQEMKFQEEGPSLKVWFRDRHYVFPKNEVILLPVNNTSTEQFSKLLAESFMKEFKKYDVSEVQVYVEETAGQGASTCVKSSSF